MKARSAAIITLKTLIVNARGALRETLEPLTDRKLIDRCAHPSGDLIGPTASTKHSLRALATGWLALTTEVSAQDTALDTITMMAAPTLQKAFGIGPDSAAEMMIVACDNPSDPVGSRIRETLRRLTDPCPDRGHQPASTLPRQSPPSKRGAPPRRVTMCRSPPPDSRHSPSEKAGASRQ